MKNPKPRRPAFEVGKPMPDGGLDEVWAADPKFFNLEYMDDNHVWIGLDLKDGRFAHINLYARGKINGRTEVE